MMSRKKAAEYFVVGWVKDWSLLSYLQVVADGGRQISVAEAHELYPWLPDQWAFLKHLHCRSHLAETNRPLSDALWDLADDRARLALAPQIEAFVAGRYDRAYAHEARKSYAKDYAVLKRTAFLKIARRESDARVSGHHWQVCK